MIRYDESIEMKKAYVCLAALKAKYRIFYGIGEYMYILFLMPIGE